MRRRTKYSLIGLAGILLILISGLNVWALFNMNSLTAGCSSNNLVCRPADSSNDQEQEVDSETSEDEGAENEDSTQQPPTTTQPSVPTTPAPASSNLMFDPNSKWISTYPYPEVVTSIPNNQLIKMTCGDRYEWRGPDAGYYNLTTQGQGSPSTAELQKANAVVSQIGSDIWQFLYCSSGSNSILLYTYCGESCGGGIGAIIGVANTTNARKEIENRTNPYPSVSPLAIKTDGTVFFKVDGGDGGGASSSIYRANFAQTGQYLDPVISIYMNQDLENRM